MNKFTKVFMLVLCLCLLICGAALADDALTCPHGFAYDLTDPVVLEPATCYVGAHVQYCAKTCDQKCVTSVYEGTPNAHESILVYDVEPTCETTGLGHWECKVCHITLDGEGKPGNKTEVVKDLGHHYTKGQLTKAATCSTDGEATYECKKCGVKLVVTYAMVCPDESGKIAVNDYMFEDATIKQGTKVVAADYGVKDNSILKADKTDVNKHVFGTSKVTVQPTCHKEGVQFKICTLCGLRVDDSYYLVEVKDEKGKVVHKVGDPKVPAIDHKYVTKTWSEKAICDQEKVANKYTLIYCELCTKVEFDKDGNFVVKDGAPVIKHADAYKAFELKEGKPDKILTAKKSCYAFKTEALEYLPHSILEETLVVDLEAKCWRDGEAHAICTVCKKEVHVQLKQLPHQYKDEPTVYPTCDQPGYYECKNCPNQKKIDKLAHTPRTVWYNGKAATCEEKAAHANATVTYGATCLLAADYHTICYFCNKIGKIVELTPAGVPTKENKPEVKHVAAKGHDWGEWHQVSTSPETVLANKDRNCETANKKLNVKEAKIEKGVVTYKTEWVAGWACNWYEDYAYVQMPTCQTPGRAFSYYHDKVSKGMIDETDMQIAALKAVDAKYEFKNPDPHDLDVQEHSWDAGKITVEPTKEAAGVKTYTCTVCGSTKTEEVKYVPTEPVYEITAKLADGEVEGKVELTSGDAAAKLWVRVTFFYVDGSMIIVETTVDDGEFATAANGDIIGSAWVLTDAAGSPIKEPGKFTDLAHGGEMVK